jgi:hypothetical protein
MTRVRSAMSSAILADGVGNVPHRPAGCRLDETDHIEPLETMMAERDRLFSRMHQLVGERHHL